MKILPKQIGMSFKPINLRSVFSSHVLFSKQTLNVFFKKEWSLKILNRRYINSFTY